MLCAFLAFALGAADVIEFPDTAKPITGTPFSWADALVAQRTFLKGHQIDLGFKIAFDDGDVEASLTPWIRHVVREFVLKSGLNLSDMVTDAFGMIADAKQLEPPTRTVLAIPEIPDTYTDCDQLYTMSEGDDFAKLICDMTESISPDSLNEFNGTVHMFALRIASYISVFIVITV
jgi:hypothetical protein